MNKLILSMLLFGLVQTAQAEQYVRSVPGIANVQLATVGELHISQGTEDKLVIEAEPKVYAQLDVHTQGDRLLLQSKGSFKTNKPLLYKLTLKSLRSLHNQASGNTDVQGFTATKLDVDAAGSGDIVLKNLTVQQLNLSLNGSGNIVASGSGNRLSSKINGTGTIDTRKFVAQSAQVAIEGSGDIVVHAEQRLQALINGAGNIKYVGKAKLTQTVNGAGEIEKL